MKQKISETENAHTIKSDRLPGLRKRDPLLGPHRRERKFPAHVSAESPSNISPNPSEVISEVSEP